MIDSYLAPTDLADARRRINTVASGRCREHEVDEDGTTVLRLTTAPVSGQLNRIKPETVCVIADLVLWRTDQRSLNALAKALEPDRVLLFVEPTADLGWRAALHRFGRRLWRLFLRHDFEADVPAQLREAGLVVTTTDRFGLGWRGLRSYVWGEARHFPNK
jgi:hypothetical protein